MNKMEQLHSQLFTIRIWTDSDGSDQAWRGQVEHILSGERQYFRDWEALVAFLQLTLDRENASQEDGPR